MICTTKGCGGLVTWVPPGSFSQHYRCQGPCGKPYKKNAGKLERIEKPDKPNKLLNGAWRSKPRKEAKVTETEKVVAEEEKTCTECGEPKPATLEFFHKAVGGKYGLNSKCKECRSLEAKKKWAKKTTLNRVPAPDLGGKPLSDNPGRDAIIAILEKKIQTLQLAIKVIREEL